MSRRIIITGMILILAGVGSAAEEETTTQTREASGDLALWYTQPATERTKALPIGNGRLGAMVYGGTEQEHLQLNEAAYQPVGDIIPYVDKNYRTRDDRAHRALAGLSMGGLQTLTVSLTRSDLFSYVGLFSSGWWAHAREEEERTVLAQYKESGKPFKLLWVRVGKLDHLAYENSVLTVDLLNKHGIKTVSQVSEGFHAWNNWREYLNLFAPKLFR